MTKFHQVTLLPEGKTIEASEDKSLLESLKSAGVYLKSTCGGHASCGDCVVVVKAGEDGLCPADFAETRLLGNVFHITKERLACQTKICGNVEIDISAHDQSIDEKRMMDKNAKVRNTALRKKADIQLDSKKDEGSTHSGPDKKTHEKLGGNRRPKAFKYSKD